MFGSTIIDIAIGIVFVFLLLSVIASTINEIILSFLNMRGKELLEGVKTLMDDANATGLVDKLYNHGQIFGLFKGNFDPKKPGNLPSYIPSQNFVMAFLDIVPSAAQALTAGEQKAMAPTADAKAPGPPDPSATIAVPTPQAPATAPPQSFTQAALPATPLSSTPPAEPRAPATSPPSTGFARDEAMFKSLWQAAQNLAEDPITEKVGKPLIAMLNTAGNDVSKLKKSLEDWYNSAMDRVSGWYKYRTQKILFGIGLVIAVSVNVDAIKIVKQLSKDSTLRQSIVAAAGAAKQPQTGSTGSANDQIKAVQQQVADVNGLGIPIGWTHVPDILVKKVREANGTSSYGPWHWGYVNVLLGWLMTAVAVSLGAPFWFDILNKIMVVRSTVKPREKSQEEASKDTTRNT
jgi:hypothetical protein